MTYGGDGILQKTQGFGYASPLNIIVSRIVHVPQLRFNLA